MLSEAQISRAVTLLDVQDITVVNLQRAVQAMIDVAAHVDARERLGVPEAIVRDRLGDLQTFAKLILLRFGIE